MKSNVNYHLVNKKISSNVYNSYGALLLKSGTVLTHKHIQLLRKNAIWEVEVEVERMWMR